jgi:hypothetical protein
MTVGRINGKPIQKAVAIRTKLKTTELDFNPIGAKIFRQKTTHVKTNKETGIAKTA